MDENEALSGQGAENAQGEHPNNQTMESLLSLIHISEPTRPY